MEWDFQSKFEVLPWCSAIQAGWRRHTRAPLLGSRQDDGAMHMRIVATPVEPLLVEPPPWWLPTQEDSPSDISQFVEMPTQSSFHNQFAGCTRAVNEYNCDSYTLSNADIHGLRCYWWSEAFIEAFAHSRVRSYEFKEQ